MKFVPSGLPSSSPFAFAQVCDEVCLFQSFPSSFASFIVAKGALNFPQNKGILEDELSF